MTSTSFVAVDCLGADAVLHHVGLAMRTIAETGLCSLCPVEDPTQRVRVCFVTLNGCPVELVEPAGTDSPISARLAKGQKLLHLCFEVDHLEETIRSALDHGFKLFREPVSAVAFDCRRIAWLYHPLWGVVELLEKQPP